MAFPSIPTNAASTLLDNTQADTTATRTFPSLTGLTKSSGNLLIAICCAYQTGTGTNAAFSGWTAGWTEFGDIATTTTIAIGAAYKFSTGSETGTISVTQAGTITGHAAMILLSISGNHASAAPEIGGTSSGTTTTATPNSLTPSWGADDTLWIALCAVGEDSLTGSFTGITADTPPTNYVNQENTIISADAIGGIQASVAFRQLNAASEDPGNFANDTSNARWRCATIAVRPPANPEDLHHREHRANYGNYSDPYGAPIANYL